MSDGGDGGDGGDEQCCRRRRRGHGPHTYTLQGAKPLEASEAASPLAKTLAVATEGAKPLEASAAAKLLAVLRKLEGEVGPV